MIKHRICFGWMLLSMAACSAQQQNSMASRDIARIPLKIGVESQTVSEHIGETVQYEVSLQNYKGERVRADRNIEIEFTCKAPSGRTETTYFEIKAGTLDGKSTCKATESGFTEVTARQVHDELRRGTKLLYVAPKQSQPREKNSPSSGATLPMARPLFLPAAFHQAPLADQLPQLVMRISSSRAFANGADRIEVLVCRADVDGQLSPPVAVYLDHAGSMLTPDPLIIRKRELCGVGSLTSSEPGSVKLKYRRASINAECRGNRAADLTFLPVITGFRIRGPAHITLIDTADVIAEFFGPDNKLIPVGEKRMVAFSNTGGADLRPENVEMDPDRWEARATVIPSTAEPVKITATTNGQVAQDLIIQVVLWPVLLLGIGGGGVGGVIGYRVKRDVFAWRVFMGVVFGLLLVWLSVWGFICGINAPVVRNEISVFFIAVIGGYIGLPVISFAAGRFGFALKK